ncbi:uncharacterized protein PRCAT00001012001 [Priceomyces carsonii]|uniref:uncharacterized protein n=1 Tax=Priceomyces carsonii TaxID=28549 RepID=UPI002EDA1E88|nr:unnamed protein product [Priceomyces carsonii]
MDSSPVSANSTKPLQFTEDYNNQIYELNYLSDYKRTSKKSRSNACSHRRNNVLITPSIKHFFRRRSYKTNSLVPSSPSYLTSQDDTDASLSSLSSDSSDSEFDTHDTPSTPNTIQSDSLNSKTKSNVHFQDFNSMSFLDNKKTSIFEIPELVHKIIQSVDKQNTFIPQESSPVRRRPLSLRHSMLIHGDRDLAESYYLDASTSSYEEPKITGGGPLFNCLQVNRLFNEIASEFLNEKLFFSDQAKFCKFINSDFKVKIQPKVFLLHKLFQMKQKSIDMIKHKIDFSRLEWIEIYMCPKLFPTPEFFINGSKIKKIIITGSKTFDDLHLILISKNCPNLEVLDIRACDLITDAGIYHIAKNCNKLKYINFGRKSRGHLVTDNSLMMITSNNKNLETVGLAGCHVSDRVIWNLAINCNATLQRLSLNNCSQLTNQSIPSILQNNLLVNLSVLEIRYVNKITNFAPLIQFKRRQEYRGISILIEACEELCLMMREQELEMDQKISRRIFTDIIDWVNKTEDGDMPHEQLLQSRVANI